VKGEIILSWIVTAGLFDDTDRDIVISWVWLSSQNAGTLLPSARRELRRHFEIAHLCEKPLSD
jgi:hypothetical protein